MNPLQWRMRRAVVALAVVGTFSSLHGAWANTVSSVFPHTQVVQGSTLSINGMGTRYKAIFRVYDMAMYTPSKVTTPEALLALPGPKRLNFVALREVPGTDLGLAFIKGLNSNSSPELVQKHTASSTRLIEIFSGKPKLVAGDTFAMEYVPGKGTTFYIQGQPQGAPVGDAEFFTMVLKIWVGPVPADFKLKDALLGL
jgi:hypothetical protein